MSDDDRHRLGASFDAAADVYAEARPGYAEAAIDWGLPPGAHRVLDLAAGTGKLTAALVERGLDVTAIDPSPAMLGRLRTLLPGVDARMGTAEAIELPTASVDAITVGSALHWFDRPQADFEMARVLRPGGVVATFGNSRTKDEPWVRAFDELLATLPARDGVRAHHRSTRLDPSVFASAEERAFAYVQRLTPERLVGLAASRSYVIAADPAARAELFERIRHLARTHPDLRGRDEFLLRYRTVVSRSTRS
jgi:SAM-dependent methyltransferase